MAKKDEIDKILYFWKSNRSPIDEINPIDDIIKFWISGVIDVSKT